MTADDYIQKVAGITGSPITNGSINYTLNFSYNTPQEARTLLDTFKLKQKELHLLKRDIHITMQEISKSYISQRVRVGKSVGAGFMRGLFGGRTVGKYNMLHRNSITTNKDQALRPFQSLLSGVDSIVLSYEKAKILIEEKLLQKKTT